MNYSQNESDTSRISEGGFDDRMRTQTGAFTDADLAAADPLENFVFMCTQITLRLKGIARFRNLITDGDLTYLEDIIRTKLTNVQFRSPAAFVLGYFATRFTTNTSDPSPETIRVVFADMLPVIQQNESFHFNKIFTTRASVIRYARLWQFTLF